MYVIHILKDIAGDVQPYFCLSKQFQIVHASSQFCLYMQWVCAVCERTETLRTVALYELQLSYIDGRRHSATECI